MARIDPIRRDASTLSEMKLLRCGEYILDAHTLQFMGPGFVVTCTRLEFRVVSALMSAQGRPLNLDRMMMKVYGGALDEPDQSCLRVVISKLRRKVRSIAGIDPIRSEPGVGYSIASGADIEVLLLDRTRMQALDQILAFAADIMPDEVALLRRAS